jgi:hypothetical protein
MSSQHGKSIWLTTVGATTGLQHTLHVYLGHVMERSRVLVQDGVQEAYAKAVTQPVRKAAIVGTIPRAGLPALRSWSFKRATTAAKVGQEAEVPETGCKTPSM